MWIVLFERNGKWLRYGVAAVGMLARLVESILFAEDCLTAIIAVAVEDGTRARNSLPLVP